MYEMRTWFEEDHQNLDARGWYAQPIVETTEGEPVDVMFGPFPTRMEAVEAARDEGW